MIDGNAILNDLIGKNWMVLILIYGIIRAIFPSSQILARVGEAFSSLFPQFRKKDQ